MGSIAATGLAAAADLPSPSPAGIPVRFTLDRPSYFTLVIDDSSGNRVRTLLSRARLPGGGNLGILRSHDGQTVRRTYWNNPDTVLISDLPGEARLQPGRWGLWRFR